MALNMFIPTIWSARLQLQLDKAQVYSQGGLVNRDWQGEIGDVGDTVKIHTIADPTIFDYTKNTDMPVPETLSDAERTLTISQAKGFNFQVDDIDAAQQQPKVMDNAMARAAYRLSDITDQYVAGRMVAGAASANGIGTDALPIVPTIGAGATGHYEQLVDLSTRLNEANVPREGRWVVIPPWFEGGLRKDQRFIGDSGNGNVLLNGGIGRAAGFDVMVSNNVPTVAAPGGAANQTPRSKIVAGHQIGTSFAEQINKVEAYRPERRFGDAVKGLHLYGAAVTMPDALAVLTAARA